ncbi:DNA translocase FtsK [Candidatus Omnitrophota bacterium]
MDQSKKNEIYAIILLAIGVLILISLISFDINDLSFYTSRPNLAVRNFAGVFGAYIGMVLFFVMGYSAYVIPALISTWVLARFLGVTPQKLYLKITGTVCIVLASSTLFGLIGGIDPSSRFKFGGVIALASLEFFLKYFGRLGTIIIIGVLFLLSILLATEFLLLPLLSRAAKVFAGNWGRFRDDMAKKRVVRKEIRKKILPQEKRAVSLFAKKAPEPIKEPAKARALPAQAAAAGPAGKERLPEKKKEGLRLAAEAEPKEPAKITPIPKDYKLPGFNLLDSPPPMEARKIQEDFDENSKILEETLSDFGVEAKVVAFNKGPVITRYELELASGVKIHKITSLGDNISLAMKAQSVRIVAPIPGKGTIGIEVPNSASALVFLKDILDSNEYSEEDSGLKMALGKDIAGSSVVADLGSMPHLLIAGATGSGKTVCVNSLIASLLFNLRPDELKFIMIDPKRVELAAYNDLPHLLAPVVTEAKKVSFVLDWLVNEMESRYEIFAKNGVRNISLYNKKFEKENDKKLPYVVVIIDELADLMMVAQSEVEGAITRLAQLSRAVGIHIILATQRPSVDVITGVIKANFPARISFKVASKVDSRTVLDMNGADKLLGKGDMLFVEPGQGKPVRAQGSLISDEEINRITDFIKSQCGPQYMTEIVEEFKKKKPSYKKFDKDEVYEEAVRVVIESKQASVSMLQRRLGLGYTRAARLIDMMEEEGIVGPYQGSRPREILVEGIQPPVAEGKKEE